MGGDELLQVDAHVEKALESLNVHPGCLPLLLRACEVLCHRKVSQVSENNYKMMKVSTKTIKTLMIKL